MALREVIEAKIKLLAGLQPGGEAEGGKQQSQRRSAGSWLQKLEALWDLPGLLAAHDKKTLSEEPVGGLLAKLGELLLASLTTVGHAEAGLQHLVPISLAALHQHVPTRQLFSLLDSLHTVLASKSHSLHAKLTALRVLREVYARRQDDLHALFPTSVQIVLKLFRASESRLAQEAVLVLASLIQSTGVKSIYEHELIWKALSPLSSDKYASLHSAAIRCTIEVARVHCPTGPEFERLVARLMKHMSGSHERVREVAGRALGSLLYFAVERQKQKQQSSEVTPKKTTASKDIVWTLQSAAAYLTFLYNKSGMRREARGALAEAFVAYLKAVPIVDLESADDLAQLLSSILSLLAAPKTQSPLDTLQALANTRMGVTQPADPALNSLQARECVRYIIREGIAKRSGEGGQQLLLRLLLASLPSTPSTNIALTLTILQEISYVMLLLGEGVAPHATLVADAIPPILAASSDLQVIWAAAMCIRSLGTAMPWLLASLLNQCFNHVTAAHAELACAKNAQDSLRQLGMLEGYGYCISAVVAGVASAPLGVPPALLTFAYQTAVSLIPTHAPSSLTDKVGMAKGEVAWAMMASMISINPRFIREELSNLFSLWKTHLATTRLIGRDEAAILAFCRSKKPALAALRSLCEHMGSVLAKEFLTHILSWLLPLLEVGTALVKLIGQVSRECGLSIVSYLQHLLAIYLAIPAAEYPLQAVALLRITAHLLIEGDSASSLLDKCLPDEDRALVPSTPLYLLDADNAPVSEGFLDPHFLWATASIHSCSLDWGARGPGGAVDVSVQLFAHLFAEQTEKNRQQLLDHFAHALKEKCFGAEQSTTIGAITVARNILCSVLYVLKTLNTRGGTFSLGNQKLLSSAHQLILGCQGHGDAVVRALVGECMGLLCRVEGSDFTDTIMPLFSAPRIKTISDPGARASTAFIVGSIHRSMGMKAGAYVSESMETLNLLIRDGAAEVYLPALHALALLIDSAGLQFANLGYGKSTMILLLSRLIAESSEDDTKSGIGYRLIGRCMNSLVAILGPELHSGTLLSAYMQSVASELRIHPNELVSVEWLQFIGQAILFLSGAFSLRQLLPHMGHFLRSPYLSVRLAAYQCLRQYARLLYKCVQADPRAMAEAPETHAELWAAYDLESDSVGQEAAAALLRLISETCSTLDAASWVPACKQLATITSRSLHKAADASPQLFAADAGDEGGSSERSGDGTKRGEDMMGESRTILAALQAKGIVPRWRTRVLAVECLRDVLRMLLSISTSGASTTLSESNDQTKQTARPAGMEWLADFVAVGFTAATATVHALRAPGLRLLKDVILGFGEVEDMEAAGQRVLEQYQSQIAAALRPAFERDSAHPEVTEAAAEALVCFFRFNVSSDPVVFRRLTGLLTGVLPDIAQIHYAEFSDEAATRVRVCLITALAHLYGLSLPTMRPAACVGIANDDPSILPANAATLAKLLRPVTGLRSYVTSLLGAYVPMTAKEPTLKKLQAFCLYDLSLVPLPSGVLALYRAAVLPCLQALASYLALPSAAEPSSLTHDEANIILGLCMRYCLEPGADPSELQACLLATETLLSSTLFSSTTSALLSTERLLELVRSGKSIADRYKASPSISHALSRFSHRIALLLATTPYIEQGASEKQGEWYSVAEELVSLVLRPLAPLAMGLGRTTVGVWWPSTSMDVVLEALAALPVTTTILSRWTSPTVLRSHIASFLLLITRTVASMLPLLTAQRVREAALHALRSILAQLPPYQRRFMANATLQQAIALIPDLNDDAGHQEAGLIRVIGLLVAELMQHGAETAEGQEEATNRTRIFPSLHEAMALRLAQSLSSQHTPLVVLDAILSILQSLLALRTQMHPQTTGEEEQVLSYYVRMAAPHIGLLLRNSRRLEVHETKATGRQVEVVDTTGLSLKAARLLLALHALSPPEQKDALFELIVAGLVGQLQADTPSGQPVLDLLTQVGGIDPKSFKQAVANLPSAQALLLHSAVRSATHSSSSSTGQAAPAGRAAAKAPRLDFSRYCS